MQMILQELEATLASEAAEQEAAENQTITIDEEDELERAKLPQYMARFKVSVCAVPTHILKFRSWSVIHINVW